jgi:TRAP-type C4-dicarboxylate transport system permease small subunit
MRTITERLDKLLSPAIRLAKAIGSAGLVILALVNTLDVLTTRFLDRPIVGVIKLSETGLVVALFIGIAVAVRSHSHVRMDMLVTRLSTRRQLFCQAIAYLATTAFLALWTWQMGLMTAQSWSIRETATGLLPYPLYPIKMILFLGLLIATLESLRQLAGSLIRISPSDSCKRSC